MTLVLKSKCGHFTATDLSLGKDVAMGELHDARGKLLKVFNVKRKAGSSTFSVSVGSSGHKATFDLDLGH